MADAVGTFLSADHSAGQTTPDRVGTQAVHPVALALVASKSLPG